ncbi:hypothetical protein LXL04_015709 [Taraxacum kok-saghyz]
MDKSNPDGTASGEDLRQKGAKPCNFAGYIDSLQEKYPDRPHAEIEGFVRMPKQRQSWSATIELVPMAPGFTLSEERISASSHYEEKVLKVDPQDQEVNSPVLPVPESGVGPLKSNPAWVLGSES